MAVGQVAALHTFTVGTYTLECKMWKVAKYICWSAVLKSNCQMHKYYGYMWFNYITKFQCFIFTTTLNIHGDS